MLEAAVGPADRFGMHRFSRLVGLLMILGLVSWSYSYSFQRIEATESRADSDQAQISSSGEPNPDFDPDNLAAPEYLAFIEAVPSGRYDVAEVPGSGDWDYGERRGRTPESPVISEDNPVTANVRVEDNAFVQAGGSVATVTDDDESDDERAGDENDSNRDGDLDEEDLADDSDNPSIMPGLYATRFGVTNCEYELRRIMEDNRDRVIGHDHVHDGRLLVTINEIEPDTFVATASCGDWSPWSPLSEPLSVAGNGDYWTGDLARGVWDVPNGCYWEKVVGFRGASTWDIEASGTGPNALVVDRNTLGVRVRQCGKAPMVRSDSPMPAEAPPWELAALDAKAHETLTYRTDDEITNERGSTRRRRRRTR